MSGNPTTTPPVTYDSLLADGLTVTSTATPALNGTYPCTGPALLAMQMEASAILLAGTTPAFADGTQSLNWPDKHNTGHSFSPAQFHELVVAMANFVTAALQYGVGLTTTPPATSVTIA